MEVDVNDIACIVLAGGQGTRFGVQKQFIQFKGKDLWRHIYEKVCSIIPKENVVVVGVDVAGGATRSYSVINGLQELKKRRDYKRVLIVEAARPLVTEEQLVNIINDNHQSVTYVLPLTSSIISKSGTYVNRNDYYKMSTPVAFDFNYIYEAYTSGKYTDMTDDTKVMYDHYGIKPYFLIGSDNLLKLTYPSDIVILETLYDKYNKR